MKHMARRCSAALAACAASLLVPTAAERASAADCTLEQQGEGRVAAIVDARSLRLDDGREIRLAGIERGRADSASGRAALAAIAAGREVTLHGDDDSPDRYGRQSAFVFVAGSQHSLQSELLRRGEALASIDIADKNCAAALAAAERAARDAKLGIWAQPLGHKKRGKFGRYSGRDWALYGGRGHSPVGPAGRGDHLPELRAKLDTGLCGDYSKAHHAGVRERQPWA